MNLPPFLLVRHKTGGTELLPWAASVTCFLEIPLKYIFNTKIQFNIDLNT